MYFKLDLNIDEKLYCPLYFEINLLESLSLDAQSE